MGSETLVTSNERRPTTGDLRAAGFVRLSVVRASSNELRASSNECLATSRGQRAAAVVASEKALDAWANKPMVPTAPGALTEPARRSRRRHIGEPFGIATAKRATCGIAAVGGYERSVDNGIRAS
jgi:hypothetical protein